jgi:hypothetical protein
MSDGSSTRENAASATPASSAVPPAESSPPTTAPPSASSTPPPPPTPTEPGRLPRWAKWVLFGALPAVFLLLLGGIVLAGFALRGTTIAVSDSVAAGTELDARLGNAALEFVPGDDNEVSVTVAGVYIGPRPSVDVTTSGGITTITGGCRNRWFGFCRLAVTVEVPRDMPIRAAGENGGISASDLDGPLDLSTRNGGIETADTTGAMSLRTVNGPVRVSNSQSPSVDAATVNGDVTLEFGSAPERVIAVTTNGPVTVEVPTDGVRYAIDASTVNGEVDTDGVRNDPGANRLIRVSTTNGAVTVEPAEE